MIFLRPILAVAAPSAGRAFRHWLLQLGGVGLIPLGLLDSSVIPIPGSMDVLTMILAERDDRLWFYYAVMATIGSVVGGYFTYRIARKGGKEALERKISPKRVTRIYAIFEKWGFAAIALPALLPPPMPMFPFLVAAGTLQYSLKKFLAAMALGRMTRYTILAFLAARYGRQIIRLISQHGHPVILGIVALLITGILILLLVRSSRPEKAAAG
jgi:membrane protein YqaA with SNARE-associated domain